MQPLFEQSIQLIRYLKKDFKRSLYNKINWKNRLIEINGARGVGKTTLMLQKAKEVHDRSKNTSAYISLDDPYFFNHSLIEVADEMHRFGITHLFIDEVHKYPAKYLEFDWSAEIKNIYDKYPALNIVYSGSSMIRIYKGGGDLSRRKASYSLPGLSFREFLQFEDVLEIPAITITDLIRGHTEYAREITSKIKIFPFYVNYIEHGYYPFYKEDLNQYLERLRAVLSLMLETDIPSIADIPFESTQKIKKLLAVIGSSVPFTPNLKKIGDLVNIVDHRTLLRYLYYLDQSGILSILTREGKGIQLLRKPDKIYLNNTNLFHALQLSKYEIGTIRETFINSMLREVTTLSYTGKGDFLADDITIEVGGKNKSGSKIRDLNNTVIAKDDIEIGIGNEIPLWLFGFSY
jgi:predicted AAA+ superfamily ATPase